MKSSLNKTVEVINELVQKHIIINNKIKQSGLTYQNYQNLKNKFNNLLELIDSNTPVSSTMNFYKCASVDTVEKTWTGYKAVLTDGVYAFNTVVTAGLKFGSAYTPTAVISLIRMLQLKYPVYGLVALLMTSTQLLCGILSKV